FFEAPHRIHSTLQELQHIAGECQIVVARELTKLHEELVRGQISLVVNQLQTARGEDTVVVQNGRQPETTQVTDPSKARSRRKARAAVARAQGLTANQLYSAIEHVKKSGDRPT